MLTKQSKLKQHYWRCRQRCNFSGWIENYYSYVAGRNAIIGFSERKRNLYVFGKGKQTSFFTLLSAYGLQEGISINWRHRVKINNEGGSNIED